MSRKPIYHEDNKNFRIISMPNDQWQAQHKVGEGGDNHIDPWKPLTRPVSKAAAEFHMNERAKHAQRAA